MNYILSNCICRCSLCPEYNCYRCFRNISVFNVKIFIYYIQRIHLLSFIFVKSLDLYIIYRIIINNNSLLIIKILCKCSLIILLNIWQMLYYRCILCIWHKCFQFICIMLIPITYKLCYIICKLMVTVDKPSSECYTISFIIEFFRIKLIEIIKLCIL